MVSESATVSGFILPGNHRSSTYAITYDAVYSKVKKATKRELIVVATMISRMIGTPVFSDRTKYSVTTRLPRAGHTFHRLGRSQENEILRGTWQELWLVHSANAKHLFPSVQFLVSSVADRIRRSRQRSCRYPACRPFRVSRCKPYHWRRLVP